MSAWLRRVRKHALVLVLLLVLQVIVFFPTLFLGRLVSPNDLHYRYFPWQAMIDVDPANPWIFDPALVLYPHVTALRESFGLFHWNPFTGLGIEGLGAPSGGVVSPFVLIPLIIGLDALFFSAVILLKSSITFLFGYLWLREELLGKPAAAAGAVVVAAAGVTTVLWLDAATSATALYPAALYFAARIARGRPVSILASAALGAAWFVSGDWRAIIPGLGLALLYSLLPVFVLRRERWKGFLRFGAGLALGWLLVLPLVRADRWHGEAGEPAVASFPLQHAAAFVDPYRYGNPGEGLWRAEEAPEAGGTLAGTTLYVGLVPLGLALAAPFARRRMRFFWVLIALLVIIGLFVAGLPMEKAMAACGGSVRDLRFLLP
ncbi:MAG TPA: hypothetical protein VM534_05700, partial [Thermoanaerobaculia bacterium]|nr:hypothetical protein [Thermoanaerobaculia bacterium]